MGPTTKWECPGRLPAALFGLLTGAALVAGCSAGSHGAGPPAGPATATGTANLPAVTGSLPAGPGGPAPASGQQAGANGAPAGDSGGVPQVRVPLNAAALPGAPCGALRPADLPALGLTPAGGQAGGTQCGWTGPSGATVRIVWQTTAVAGLLDVYADRSSLAYFQPTTVDGYPAVYASAFGDRRAQGDCTIYAAVNDSTVFSAEYQAAPGNAARSCPLAAQAAAAVIHDLGGA